MCMVETSTQVPLNDIECANESLNIVLSALYAFYDVTCFPMHSVTTIYALWASQVMNSEGMFLWSLNKDIKAMFLWVSRTRGHGWSLRDGKKNSQVLGMAGGQQKDGYSKNLNKLKSVEILKSKYLLHFQSR